MMALEAQRALSRHTLSHAPGSGGGGDGAEGASEAQDDAWSVGASAAPGGGSWAGGAGGGATIGLFDDVAPAGSALHSEYMGAVAPVFQRFVHEAMASTMEKCNHDVAAMTRYVSWGRHDSHTKDALRNLLVAPVHEALEARFEAAAKAREEVKRRSGGRRRGRRGGGDGDEGEASAALGGYASYDELVEGFTETLMTRRVGEPMRQLLNDLVVEIIRAWREEFCRTISVKLNACFLLPFCDALPNQMRKQVKR